MDQASVAVSETHTPHALVNRAISVLDCTQAVSHDLTPREFCLDDKLTLVEVLGAISVAELVQGVLLGLMMRHRRDGLGVGTVTLGFSRLLLLVSCFVR